MSEVIVPDRVDAGNLASPSTPDRLVVGHFREPPTEIDLEEGDQILRDGLTRWFRRAIRYRDGQLHIEAENEIYRVTAGAGKSEHALNELIRMQRADDQVARIQRALFDRDTVVIGGRAGAMPDDFPDVFGELTVWVVLPSIKLARELLDRFEAKGGRGCLIRGRDHEFEKGKGGEPCMRPDLVRELKKRGIFSVSRHVCKNVVTDEDGESHTYYCPFYNECEYNKQFPNRGTVIFTSSERLFEVQPEALRKPHVVLIDESVINQTMQFGFKPSVKSVEKEAGIAAEWFDRMQFALENQRVPQSYDPDEAAAILAVMKEQFKDEDDNSQLRPDLDEETILSTATRRKRPDVMKLLEFAKDWKPGQTILDAYIAPYQKGHVKVGMCLHLQRRRDIRVKAPFVMLDATVDPVIAEKVWGARTVDVPIRRNLAVIQTHGLKASIQYMRSDKSENTRHRIGLLCELMGETGLLIANKEAKFDLPPGWSQTHFNALRGIDSYRDLDNVVVVGRPQPSSFDARCNTLGLLWDRVDEDEARELAASGLAYKTETRGYLTPEEGFGAEIEVGQHPLIERVRAQTCEAELVQALDRVRAVRAETSKIALLISERPLDVPLSVLVSWKSLINTVEVRVAYHRLGGFLPANGPWLASRFPDLFRSARAAKDAVQRYEDPVPLAGYHKYPWHVLRMGATRHEVPSGKRGQPYAVWSEHSREAVEAWARDHLSVT